MSNRGILLVLSGFSGAGKGTLVKKLLEEHEDYAISVSMTTRNPRPGEVDGRDYFFVSKEKFEETIAANGFVEHACYVGNYYGTPKAYVEEQLNAGKNVILEIEIQGAMNVKKIYPDCLLLFITPPSAEELERRLRGRGTETDEVIAGRLARAYEESQGMDAYDYIVMNDDLEECATEVAALVDAVKHEPARMQSFIAGIREQLSVYRKEN